MKTAKLTVALVLSLVLGCATQQSGDYALSAEPSPELGPLCDNPETVIPFLKKRLLSPDYGERVAAYAALQALLDQARRDPTPDGARLIDLINPEWVDHQLVSPHHSSMHPRAHTSLNHEK